MASNILQLSNLISSSVASLVETCSKNNLRIPDLNETFSPESEAFRSNPDVNRSTKIIAAAAFQLAACVLSPHESIIHATSGHMKSAALRVSIECHVAEILGDAGPEGMHLNEIAAKTDVDGVKLGRTLRLLANRHIFREIRPDFFINNRLSGVLSTGKPVNEILHDPGKKHDGTSGFVAYMELLLAGCHKGSAYLVENMKDPTTAFSVEPNKGPFQRAMRTEKTLFEWLNQPEQAYDRHYFGIAMRGTTSMIPPNLLLELFDWPSLPNEAIVVDVGGGIGSCGRQVLKAHPHLRFIVQDLLLVTEDGTKHWEKEDPELLASGRIKFQVHDFFNPQPIQEPSVFLLKNILHDWSDAHAEKILTNLRESAKPDTILLVFDIVMSYSCRETSLAIADTVISEDPMLVAPDLLTTGFNSVTDMVWTLDTAIHILTNARERTLPQFQQLFSKCGWLIIKVTRKGSSLDSLQAIPV